MSWVIQLKTKTVKHQRHMEQTFIFRFLPGEKEILQGAVSAMLNRTSLFVVECIDFGSDGSSVEITVRRLFLGNHLFANYTIIGFIFELGIQFEAMRLNPGIEEFLVAENNGESTSDLVGGAF